MINAYRSPRHAALVAPGAHEGRLAIKEDSDLCH